MNKNLFLSLFCIHALFAEHPVIENISIVSDEAMIQDQPSDEKMDIQVPCNQAYLEQVLSPFLGKEISEENLQGLKDAVQDHFADNEDSFVRVRIPAQKVIAGRVTLVALPATVEQVCVTGNCWFPTGWIKSKMNICPGDCVQETDLLNSVAWMNRNPFIHGNVILCKGNQDNSTKIRIAVNDRLPFRVYAGTDNTGTHFTGNERFFTGINASIGLSAMVTYQFTSDYEFKKLLAHYANFTYFLPWMHEISAYGGYATIRPNISNFESKGKDIQASLRYKIPFKPLYKQFQHQFITGADFKQIDSSLFFIGALSDGTISRLPVSTKTAQLFQILAAYQFQDVFCNTELDFKFETYMAPFKFLPDQTATAYQTIRPGATTRYVYARAALGMTRNLPACFKMTALLRGQLSSSSLLPSEQYRLGGYDTVRGYQEGVYLADDAVIGNLEVHSPTWTFIDRCGWPKDSLYFLAFIDAAYGKNEDASPAFPNNAYLVGIGPGVRYSLGPNLMARCDYGFRLHQTSFSNSQIGRFHFSLVAAY